MLEKLEKEKKNVSDITCLNNNVRPVDVQVRQTNVNGILKNIDVHNFKS